MAASSGEPLRLVILGKTGVGKSHVGNVILGRNAFVSKSSARSVTATCTKAQGEGGVRRIEVVDTPGVIDTDRDEKDIAKEILRSIYESQPGPHAFLLVIQVGRFAKEELRAVKALQEIFGPKVADYTIVVFNRVQELDEDETLESYVQSSPKLSGVVNDCAGRYASIDNNLQNRSQVTDLANMVDRLVSRNGGNCFSNSMYKQSTQESSLESFISRMLHVMSEQVGKFFKSLFGL